MKTIVSLISLMIVAVVLAVSRCHLLQIRRFSEHFFLLQTAYAEPEPEAAAIAEAEPSAVANAGADAEADAEAKPFGLFRKLAERKRQQQKKQGKRGIVKRRMCRCKKPKKPKAPKCPKKCPGSSTTQASVTDEI